MPAKYLEIIRISLLLSCTLVIAGCYSPSRPSAITFSNGDNEVHPITIRDGSISWEQPQGLSTGPFFLGGYCGHVAIANLVSMYTGRPLSPASLKDRTRLSPMGLHPNRMIELLNEVDPNNDREWILEEVSERHNPLEYLKDLVQIGRNTNGVRLAAGPSRANVRRDWKQRFPVTALVALDPTDFRASPSSAHGLRGAFEAFYRQYIDGLLPYKFYLHYATIVDITDNLADGCVIHSNSWGGQQQTYCDKFLAQWSMENLQDDYRIESSVLSALSLRMKNYLIYPRAPQRVP